MNMSSDHDFEYMITFISLIITTASVFTIDCITPGSYPDWFFYLVIIYYASLKLPRKNLVILSYAGAVLTAAGYFFSPEGQFPEIAIINRITGILIIWILTSLLYKQNKDRDQKKEIEKQFGIFLTRMSPAGIVYFDTDGKITVADKKFADFLGYRDDEILGRNILEYIHPDYREGFLISKEKIVLNMQNSGFLEEKLIKKNKESVLANVTLNITQNKPVDSRFLEACVEPIKEWEESAVIKPTAQVLLK